MTLDPRRVKELFNAALDVADPQARQALLNRECGVDVPLRQRLEMLLQAHDQPVPALDKPLVAEVAGPTAAYVSLKEPDPAEAVGSVIAGRYKLLQLIGEGGMGAVYMADQIHPVKRRVAVKVIKAGMDSARVLARFEAERQALALMDHPNIAKVLDAGTTDSGRPFFVMELVKGIPLTQFCDEHKLPVLDRLNLFMQVCSAVQHAHQKGIIHRDLKPTNILVESHDGRPVPKAIDFGLAKATSGLQLTEHTLFTALGQVAGTPLYMAPEQAAFNAIDVDTRADIYSLGVILYELLTGTTPIERETFKRAAFDEILRVIREQEPPTPSSRISSSESKASVAALRQMEPIKLGRFVCGELDWIVMKALSKERDRRYDSATAFAKDVERFLNHEPVQAGPPSAAYKLRKLVRRNRPQVIAAAMILLALIAGMAGTTFGLIRAEQSRAAEFDQRTLAERKQREAEASAKSEAEHRRRAESEHQRAEELAFLYEELFSRTERKTQIQVGQIINQEFEIKAALLAQLGLLVEWPENVAGINPSSFVIGVLGTDPFGALLDRIAATKTVRGRKVVIQRFSSMQEFKPCHILFVGAVGTRRKEAAQEYLERVLPLVKERNVLTVGQMEGFAHRGGHIEFVIADNHVRFRVNAEAIASAGLKIDDRVLKLPYREAPRYAWPRKLACANA
jgi:tRNA A-37 threonylcarbamoyl transferase component Bud32